MQIKSLLTSNSVISIKNKFISPRLIKVALEGKVNLRVVEESPTKLKAKIVRFARIYGAPIIWPNATIEIDINNEKEFLYLQFKWPDYYLVLGLAVVVVLSSFDAKMTLSDIIPLIILHLFFILLIFLDQKYVSLKIKRALLKLKGNDT